MAISKMQKIKLESMQIKGIRAMIWQNIKKEEIESRLLQIKNQSHTNDIHKLVNSQSRSVLIELIEKSFEITSEIIDDAYEKYRYGLKPGFTLFWAKRDNKIFFDLESLENKIKEFTSKQKYQDDGKYKNLEFVSIVEFNGTYEITLSYLQKFNYINEDGEFTYLYMMKDCFAWVGIDKNFIAINNMPDMLMNLLKRFFSDLYRADITNIKLTNSLLKKVFPNNKTKRMTKHNANPPENQLEKITIADQNLSEKMDCIPEGYDDYDITNTQYVEEIDENTTGTLGVNCDKGKMYLSKSLTSSQFREWSTRRIDDIISYFKSSSDITLETIVGYNMFSSSAWDDIKQTAKVYLNQIVHALVNCKNVGATSFPIDLDVYKVYAELSDHFYESVHGICDTCEEVSIPYCVGCGSANFAIPQKTPVRIICQDCGKIYENSFEFECEAGHSSIVEDIRDVIDLTVSDGLLMRLINTIRLYFPDFVFEKDEYFSLARNTLVIHKSPKYEKLNASDIDTFIPIVNREITHNISDLHSILHTLKEKCAHPTNEECATCKYNRLTNSRDVKCILQLFANFEGFTPQPHQGHEFGDISMLVSCAGCNITFLGVAKSVDGSKSSKITKASKTGREIIQQVIDALNDSRAELIGVVYPDLLDDQLKYLLLHEAKIRNKKLVVLDKEFMTKLLDKYLTDHGL